MATYLELLKLAGKSMQDRLSDLTTRLRNAALAGKKVVTLPHTKLLEAVSLIMQQEKYLQKVEVDRSTSLPSLRLTLTYSGDKPAINHIKRISKPGVRIYSSTRALKPVLAGLGIAIISTSAGVMSNRKAHAKKLGGEVLVELW